MTASVKLRCISSGVIHGDLNDQNMVVGPDPADGSWTVTAVLDFGDTQRSCRVFELAITVCYVMLLAAESNPLDAAGHVIAGYSTVRPLPDVEFNILKVSRNWMLHFRIRTPNSGSGIRTMICNRLGNSATLSRNQANVCQQVHISSPHTIYAALLFVKTRVSFCLLTYISSER